MISFYINLNSLITFICLSGTGRGQLRCRNPLRACSCPLLLFLPKHLNHFSKFLGFCNKFMVFCAVATSLLHLVVVRLKVLFLYWGFFSPVFLALVICSMLFLFWPGPHTVSAKAPALGEVLWTVDGLSILRDGVLAWSLKLDIWGKSLHPVSPRPVLYFFQ